MAIVLAYDDLPPGSDIRREFCDGGVKLTIPSGSVPHDLRRRVFRSAVIPAAAITSAIAVLCISGVWIFFVPERLEAELMPLALALTGVVTVAGFTLIWRVLALSMIGVLEQARRQTTVLYADRERLLVESDGQMGTTSRRLAPEQIREIRIGRQWFYDAAFPAIEIAAGAESLLIAPGRDEREARWIIRSLQAVLKRVEP